MPLCSFPGNFFRVPSSIKWVLFQIFYLNYRLSLPPRFHLARDLISKNTFSIATFSLLFHTINKSSTHDRVLVRFVKLLLSSKLSVNNDTNVWDACQLITVNWWGILHNSSCLDVIEQVSEHSRLQSKDFLACKRKFLLN